MKKRKPCIVLAAVLVMALVGGCAGFKEFVGLAAEKVCGFSLQESEEAQMAMSFISVTAPIVGAVAGVPITQAQAEAILNQVAVAGQTGACVLLTDLTNALAFFDALSAEYAAKMQTVKMKALYPEVRPPSVMRLRARMAGE